MARALESSDKLFNEPIDQLIVPIRGYEDQPILPLYDTIRPISEFFNDIDYYICIALQHCQNPLDGLDQEESASICLYTMEFDDEPSLYHLLNQALREKNCQELKLWFPYLKLFLTALYKLPSQSKTVWRGIKNMNLSLEYKKGEKFIWWDASSCTTNIEVIETFLGKTGERTMFSIECFNGKPISNHSYFEKKENEILLLPGSYFEVIGQLNPVPQFHIIQLREISLPIPLIKPPFITSSTTDTDPVDQSLSPTFQSTTYEIPNMDSRNKFEKLNRIWKQNPIVIAGRNGKGNKLKQFSYPSGIFIDDRQNIYIADSENHRIVEWKLNSQKGRTVAGGNGQGNRTNQLNDPRDVIVNGENNSLIIADWGNKRVMKWSLENNTTNGQIIIEDIYCWGLAIDKDGSLYVSDCVKNEVRRWRKGKKNGKIVAGGNGQGDQLNQFNDPTFIFVDDNYSLYVSDFLNHRVMKWIKHAKEGVIVAGGNGAGNSLKQLSSPQGVIVDHSGVIYVSDYCNHRVMCWCEGDDEGKVVVSGNGQRDQSDQLHYPQGLSFDTKRNLNVVDQGNHRILKYELDLNSNKVYFR